MSVSRSSVLSINPFILNRAKQQPLVREKEKAVLKEEKKEEVISTSFVAESPYSFSPCKQSKKRKAEEVCKVEKIEAAVTWDVDKTLIDEKGNLLFSERVKKLLKKIKDNGFANIIVTARPHVKALTDSTHRFSVNHVRERLGQDLFDGTYYTSGKDKDLVLDQIVEDLGFDTPSQLCHVDDDEGYLAPIREKGYVVAKVNLEDLSSDEHLSVVENHLERMIMLKNMTEEDLEKQREAKRRRRI